MPTVRGTGVCPATISVPALPSGDRSLSQGHAGPHLPARVGHYRHVRTELETRRVVVAEYSVKREANSLKHQNADSHVDEPK